MKQEKLNLISKLFEGEEIRTVWDGEEEKYFVSVVDVVGVLTDSKDKITYWRKLKQRLKDEGNETVTNCHGLKLKAKDGKYRKTDVCDIEGIFRIIESIPSKKAEPIKLWLARLGSERVDEIFDPSISIQRAIDLYRTKGYDETWISKRIKSMQERKSLTDVWQESGISGSKEFAILTNEVYKSWSGMSVSEYKSFKGLKKESLRDNMDSIELLLTDLSEEATKRLAIKRNPIGLAENVKVSKIGGSVARIARETLEEELGESVVTRANKNEVDDKDNNFF